MDTDPPIQGDEEPEPTPGAAPDDTGTVADETQQPDVVRHWLGRLRGLAQNLAERLEQQGRLRLALVLACVLAVALLAGLVVGTCFRPGTSDPIVALGLGDDAVETTDVTATAEAEPAIDPEQQVFAERRQRELAERQRLEASAAVPDFTDHALVAEMSGLWSLDLSRGRRGFRVRFGADPVRTVHRERFDVTLFAAEGRGLPPYFTVLDLPDGKLLAFLDPSGSFRLVLEDLRRESDGRLSWRGSGFDRRYGRKLDGPSPWRFGADLDDRDEDRGEDDEWPTEDEPWSTRRDDERPRIGVRELPAPSVSESAAFAEVERHVDELSLGLMERQPGRVFALWAGRPDDVTRAAVGDLLDRYATLRVWARVLSVELVATAAGTEARFEAVVTVQGVPRRARNRRDVDLRDIRWRGRIRFPEDGGDGVQVDPFPG